MSEKQIAASRANGAKSRGPKTEEGRKQSSLNAITHGLTSELVLIKGESKEAFHYLRQAYLDRFQPADPVEADLIEQMVAASWRLRRAWAMETEALEATVVTVLPEVQKQYEKEVPPDAPLCVAMQSLMGEKSQFLANLSRHEARHARLYHRAMQNLLRLRDIPPSGKPSGAGPRPASPSENTQIEPEPLVPPSPCAPVPHPPVTSTSKKQVLLLQALPSTVPLQPLPAALPSEQDDLDTRPTGLVEPPEAGPRKPNRPAEKP